MSKQLRTTVGIVGYNHSAFIAQCLESILSQEECEIIVADDCSSDNSQKIIHEWYQGLNVSDKKRVSLLLSPKNQGLTKTLNDILAKVTTEYFVYLAADDWSLPDRLMKQADYMDKTNVALSYSDVRRAREDGSYFDLTFYETHPQWRKNIGSENPLATIIREGNWIPAPSVMFRTSALREIGGFDADIAFEDQDTYARIMEKFTIGFLNGAPLAVHRELNNSFGAQIFQENSLKWLEGISRTESKFVHLKSPLRGEISAKLLVRLINLYKLGGGGRWKIKTMLRIFPFIPKKNIPLWAKYFFLMLRKLK